MTKNFFEQKKSKGAPMTMNYKNMKIKNTNSNKLLIRVSKQLPMTINGCDQNLLQVLNNKSI